MRCLAQHVDQAHGAFCRIFARGWIKFSASTKGVRPVHDFKVDNVGRYQFGPTPLVTWTEVLLVPTESNLAGILFRGLAWLPRVGACAGDAAGRMP